MISTYQLQRAVARYVRGRTRSTAEIELAWMRLAVQLQRELGEQHEIFDRDAGVFVARFFRASLPDMLHDAAAARAAAEGLRADATGGSPLDQAVSRARRTAVNAAHRMLGEATRSKHQSLGITRYRWVSSQDQRVRRRHRELNKTIQRWDDPPVSNPETGRRAHPGEDYGCRCTASPILDDIETLLAQPAPAPARRAEDRRKLRAALAAAQAVPQNQRVLAALEDKPRGILPSVWASVRAWLRARKPRSR